MRIRFLLMDAYAAGGTIRTTYNTASCLAQRHDVEIVSVYQRRAVARITPDPPLRVRALSREVGTAQAEGPGGPGRLMAVLGKAPSVVIPLSERRYRHFSLRTDIQLARYLRSLRDGVLVSTRPGLNIAAARLTRKDVVVVGQEHLHLGNNSRALCRSMARAYRRLDLVTTLTEGDARDYRAMLQGRTRVVCVPNAAPEARQHTDGGAKVVVAAGRLTPQKGFDRLIPAFAGVAELHPDWRLRIFGAGRDRALLQGLIVANGLEGRVMLMGHTDRLAEELADAAIFVLSSRAEGFPMVVLEAMAVGLPVVSFDCPTGPADMITNGIDGLLVRDGDVAALSASIRQLIGDPQLRARMGTEARRTAARYDQRTICARWEEVLAELIGKDGRR
jgi:glycosyltransferase involved in cell wall biosynthesis